MSIISRITDHIVKAGTVCFNTSFPIAQINLEPTRPDVKGDLTLVVFPLVRLSKRSPEDTAQEIGRFLLQHIPEIASFNVIKGFLNLCFTDGYFLDQTCQWLGAPISERIDSKESRRIVIEFSSPNTNKPLHLGHIRNNLLGFSLSRLLMANGHQVYRVNLVNDRGIHICKSMLAWLKWGNGETPEKSGIKGDHLVGKYYVLFDQYYKEEAAALMASGVEEKEVMQQSSLMEEARQMLRQWEANDAKTRSLWEMMNNWVYEGFTATYHQLGIDFDKIYYESQTYQLGKVLVQEGLDMGVFHKRQDGSVWVDLSNEGLDEKLLLRSDGTSVYITQDIGTAQLRHDDYEADELVYVVGNEQNYHFDVLQKVMARLGREWSQRIRHYSYGMVELPHGRMKSREGTVVDADDLMAEMLQTARKRTEELGKLEDLQGDEATELFRIVGLAALKYYILKVDPKKTMTFNPEESVDFNGNTGPFIQYTYARIRSVQRKADAMEIQARVPAPGFNIEDEEKELLKWIMLYQDRLKEAGMAYSPALIANYAYDLAREFNQFYQSCPILKAESPDRSAYRLALAGLTADTLKHALWILGIEVPERM
ncbi:MAG: arginine--tRNA ligase [Lentimicrobiaceae bacterium]|nr:arginine--tRNA ligase [Lentimicrobiaceae bacterium]